MKKFVPIVLLYSFIFSACASQTPAPTATPTALPADTSTATLLPTFTPTPIPATPTPEHGFTPEHHAIIDGWNGHIYINENGQFLNQSGAVIEGLFYNKETKMVEITRSDVVGHPSTERFDLSLIEVTPEGDVIVDYNFKLGENGQLERQMYPETSEYQYSQSEIARMNAENHSTAPGANIDSQSHAEEIFSNFLVKPPSGVDWYIKFGDFYESIRSPGGTFFWANKVKVWNSETNEVEVINTSEFAIRGFGGKSTGDPSYAVVAWMDANDNPIIKIVHGPRGINDYPAWLGDFIQ